MAGSTWGARREGQTTAATGLQAPITGVPPHLRCVRDEIRMLQLPGHYRQLWRRVGQLKGAKISASVEAAAWAVEQVDGPANRVRVRLVAASARPSSGAERRQVHDTAFVHCTVSHYPPYLGGFGCVSPTP